MAKLFAILTLINQIFPVLIGIIRQVEEAIPGSGAGEQKLAMVRGILETAWGTTSQAEVGIKEAWPVIQALVAGAVSALNVTGWKK